MFNFQLNKKNTFLFLICYFLFLIVLAGCSTQKQILKSAERLVIKDSALSTAHVGISIFDPAANKYLFNYQGDHYFVPASNTKLPTCYAAMKYLGDSLVAFRYTSVDSTIEVTGTGDPTFLHPDFKSQPALVFLKRFTSVVLRANRFLDTYLGSGWSWTDYQESYMAQRSGFPIYGNVVHFELIDRNTIRAIPSYFNHLIKIPNVDLAAGFELYKPWESNEFNFSSGKQKNATVPFNPYFNLIGNLLGDTLKAPVFSQPWDGFLPEQIIHSQPTDSVLKPMMHNSDNFFAEQMLLMVSNERLGFMNDEKIIDTLLKTDFKNLPQKPNWADGCGLSRYNLFTPQDFVTILYKMKNEFGMDRIKNILATGNEGTLEGRYKTEAGYIFAKTGTLSGVIALSGFLYTKKNKLLIFSVLINNHNSSATAVRNAVERFIRALREKY
jgi:D-alanyl-D-alanine carboxypeptidase/D-alanyl-D-alanine-endopeptidase (penicillin-binding protein 4)